MKGDVFILKVRPAPRDHSKGTVAYFDVRLFGELNLKGCELRRIGEDFAFTVSNPRVRLHGAALRTLIKRAALEAYASMRAAGPPEGTGFRPPGDGSEQPQW